MGQSRNSKMRNSVKMFALILIMSVFLRGIEGARIYAIGPAYVKTDRPIAGGNNVTQPTGLVGTGAITIGGGLGARTCPLIDIKMVTASITIVNPCHLFTNLLICDIRE